MRRFFRFTSEKGKGPALLDVVGTAPEDKPYIRIEIGPRSTSAHFIGTITDPRSLRRLAREIIEALGEQA